MAETNMKTLIEYNERINVLCEELRVAASMLGSVAGDLEDGYSLGDVRGKYVLVLLNARDRARAAIEKAKQP